MVRMATPVEAIAHARPKLDGTTLGQAVAAAKWAREQYRQRTTWTISIDDADPMFRHATAWLAQTPGDRPHGIRLSTGNGRRDDIVDEPVGRREIPPADPITVSTSDSVSRDVTVAGHQVKATIHTDEPAGRERPAQRRLAITCRTADAMDAVTEHLREIMRNTNRRKPALHLMGSWGGWSRRDDLPARPLDTVHLPAGVLESLDGHVSKFLGSEAVYARRGMPWHMGLLLSGAPGNGKTSIVRALAHHYGLDLFYASLGDLKGDTSLLNLVGELRPRSILLLEDVDVYAASHARDEGDGGETGGAATLAGLLNALDGVATPHGLIKILTTNHRDALDPALLRAGRVDHDVVIPNPDTETLGRLWQTWYGSPAPGVLYPQGRCTADVVGVLHAHEDPTEAYAALCSNLLQAA